MPRGSSRLGWILILLAGCGREPEPPAPPPAPAPPDLPSLGDVRPTDWNEIDPEKVLPLEAGEVPPDLRWDFSEGRQYSYDFTQTLSQVVVRTLGDKRESRKSRDRNGGKFVFVAGTGNRAKAAIAIRTEESSIEGVPIDPEALKKNKPTQFQCSVRDDGTGEVTKRTGQADARFFFDALLSLRVGTRKVKDGSVTTRVAGRFKVGRYECIRLETDFEYAPETRSGHSLIRGRTVAYFALPERKFVRASTAMSARLAARVRSEDGAWAVSELRTETTQRLKLRERD